MMAANARHPNPPVSASPVPVQGGRIWGRPRVPLPGRRKGNRIETADSFAWVDFAVRAAKVAIVALGYSRRGGRFCVALNNASWSGISCRPLRNRAKSVAVRC
jgi:hypothetical protein